jgi:hypothetical protein
MTAPITVYVMATPDVGVTTGGAIRDHATPTMTGGRQRRDY